MDFRVATISPRPGIIGKLIFYSLKALGLVLGLSFIFIAIAPILAASLFEVALKHGWADSVPSEFLHVFPLWSAYTDTLHRFGVDDPTIRTVLFELSICMISGYAFLISASLAQMFLMEECGPIPNKYLVGTAIASFLGALILVLGFDDRKTASAISVLHSMPSNMFKLSLMAASSFFFFAGFLMEMINRFGGKTRVGRNKDDGDGK